MMNNIYDELAGLLDSGETVAVATVIAVRGSVPREVGAKMIIHPLGRHVGTVGGGCGEADVIRAALDVIQTGRPTVVKVDLTEDVSLQALGVCGGIMEVFVEQAAPGIRESEASAVQRVAALREAVSRREPVALVTAVRGPDAGRQAVVWLNRAPLGDVGTGIGVQGEVADARAALQERQHRLLRYPETDTAVFVEVQRRAPELVIAGAGHIALPLAQMASMCDFAVTVLDDRASFANPERFPTAQRVIAGPMRASLRDLDIDRDSYIVLVTRGHSLDVECLLDVLDRPAGYIGMIGSQRRVDAVFQLLEKETGIDPAKFERVYAPIGIAIGAHTPAEIAVCILAELINVLRGGPAASISDQRRDCDRKRRAANGTR
jgi:xanthine dehydrogenase accessory factor